MIYIFNWLLFLVGIIIGVLIALLTFLLSTSGTLRIDHSNPEKDLYRFDIDNLDELSRKKRIVLKVDNHADLSQK
jgi:hypothetical protein